MSAWFQTMESLIAQRNAMMLVIYQPNMNVLEVPTLKVARRNLPAKQRSQLSYMGKIVQLHASKGKNGAKERPVNRMINACLKKMAMVAICRVLWSAEMTKRYVLLEMTKTDAQGKLHASHQANAVKMKESANQQSLTNPAIHQFGKSQYASP